MNLDAKTILVMLLFFGPPIIMIVMAFKQPFFYPIAHIMNFLLAVICYITAKGTVFNNQLVRPSPIIYDMVGIPGRRIYTEDSHSGKKRVLIALNIEYVKAGKEEKRSGWEALSDFISATRVVEVIDSGDKFIDIPISEGGPPEGASIYAGKFFGGTIPEKSFLEAATITKLDSLVKKQTNYETALKRLYTQISTLTRESDFTDAGKRDKIQELVEDFGRQAKVALPSRMNRMPGNNNQRGDPNYPNQSY